MNGQLWAALAGAFVTFVAAVLALPKIRAEARKANADSALINWKLLTGEIQRLDRELGEVRAEFAAFRKDAAARESALEQENRRLRDEVGRLKRRVRELESVIKIVPITPDMQALLDQIDDADTKGAGK